MSRASRTGADWVASWRLTRSHLRMVARGVLPRAWVAWARRDLATTVPPGSFIVTPHRERALREKL